MKKSSSENEQCPPEVWFAAYYGEEMNKVSFPVSQDTTELLSCQWIEGSFQFWVDEVPLYTDEVSIFDKIECVWNDEVIPKFSRVVKKGDHQTLRFKYTGILKQDGTYQHEEIEEFIKIAEQFYDCHIRGEKDLLAICFPVYTEDAIDWILDELAGLPLKAQNGAALAEVLEGEKAKGEIRYKRALWTLKLE